MFKSHEIKFMALIFYVAFAAEGKAPPPPSRFLDGGDVAERVAALILRAATIAFGDRGGVLTMDSGNRLTGFRFKTLPGKASPPPSRFLDGGDVAERVTTLILHAATIAFGDRGGALTTDSGNGFQFKALAGGLCGSIDSGLRKL